MCADKKADVNGELLIANVKVDQAVYLLRCGLSGAVLTKFKKRQFFDPLSGKLGE